MFSSLAMPTTSASSIALPMILASRGSLILTLFTLLILNELRVVVMRPLSTVTVSPTRKIL